MGSFKTLRASFSNLENFLTRDTFQLKISFTVFVQILMKHLVKKIKNLEKNLQWNSLFIHDYLLIVHYLTTFHLAWISKLCKWLILANPTVPQVIWLQFGDFIPRRILEIFLHQNHSGFFDFTRFHHRVCTCDDKFLIGDISQ